MVRLATLILSFSILVLIWFSVSAQKNLSLVEKDSLINNVSFNAHDSTEFPFANQYLMETINNYRNEKTEYFYKQPLQGDWYTNSIYAEQLKKLKEPDLSVYDQEAYRFTWIGYLGTSHNPFSIRIERRDTTIVMVVKFIESRHRKDESTYKLWGDTLEVGELVWSGLKNHIASSDFWNIPTVEITDIVIMDGSEWIFEGKENSLYHPVQRPCGGIDTGFKKLCLYLLENSGIEIKKKEFY